MGIEASRGTVSRLRRGEVHREEATTTSRRARRLLLEEEGSSVKMTMQDALNEICASIRRGKGTFAVTPSPLEQVKPFSLTVGSIRAVQVPDGFIITLGLSRDQVEKLREMCDELLDSSGTS